MFLTIFVMQALHLLPESFVHCWSPKKVRTSGAFARNYSFAFNFASFSRINASI